MGSVIVNESSLQGIADAIRSKLNVDTTYLPSQMADAIESMDTGGTDLTSADEGKVVVESGGDYVLQAQTSRNISSNGTYDTTTNDEVTVAVASSANIYGGTSPYWTEAGAGTLLAILDGRSYYKTNGGGAYAACAWRGNYTQPYLVSEDADAVTFTVGSITYAYSGTVTYGGKTFYYSNTGMAMPGDLTPTDGIATKIDGHYEDSAKAVLAILEIADAQRRVELTSNGTYEVPSGYDGFGDLAVNVRAGLASKYIIANGTYLASSDSLDGYSRVVVNVSGAASANDLLFHFDDDMSNSGRLNALTVTPTGYVLSDEQAKFGTHSLKVDGNPDTAGAVYLDSSFAFGTDDFTIDFWSYLTAFDGGAAPFSFTYRSLAYYMLGGTMRGIAIASSSGSWAVDHSTQVYDTDIANGWHHIAITRESGTIRTFVDGVMEDEFTFNSSFAATEKLSFGTNSYKSSNWRGYIDEFRILLGTAVWTDNFTPPTEPYPDGGSGSGGDSDDWTALTEYIQSSGTQYIDTGYKVIPSTWVEMVANFENTNGSPLFFGARDTASSQNFWMGKSQANNVIQDGHGSTYTNYLAGSPARYGGSKCRFTKKQDSSEIAEDSMLSTGVFYGDSNVTGSYNLTIFTLNTGGSISTNYTTMKLYRFRIYEGDTLVHEFVPWTDANDVVCLEDLVTGDIKYNLGTGTFTLGTDS